MSIQAIGSATTHTPQKTSEQSNVAQMEKQIKSLQEELKEIKQADKLDPQQKQRQVETLEKRIAELERKLARLRGESQTSDAQQTMEQKRQQPPHNNLFDEYA